MLSYALDDTVSWGATLKLRLDWLVFVLDKETRQDANALKKILDKLIRKHMIIQLDRLTVCGGGR